MKRREAAAVLVVLALVESVACSQPAQFGLVNLRFVESSRGPRRTMNTFMPYEQIVIAGTLVHIPINDKKKMEVQLEQVVLDPNGKEVHRSGFALSEYPLFGTDAPIFARVIVGPDQPRGKYTVILTARDKTTGQTAEARLPFALIDPSFDILNLRFALDAQGAVECAPPVLVGDQWFIVFDIVGAGRIAENVAVWVNLLIADGADKPIFAAQPALRLERPATEKEAQRLVASVRILFSRPGKFRLRLDAYDRAANRTVSKVLAVEVISPN